MQYVLIFLGTLLFVAGMISRTQQWVAVKMEKQQRRAVSFIPSLGGWIIFLGLAGAIWFVSLTTPYLLERSIQVKHLLGITLAGLSLVIGGYLHDTLRWRPSRQWFFVALAIFIIIASGIGIRQITNPFGGTISLVSWEKTLFWWQGIPQRLTLPADLFTLSWLILLIATTKSLNGVHGLAPGMTTIGALMIFLLAMTTKYFQPEVGMLAIIVAGAFSGFLFGNPHVPRISLGTGGSLAAGFSLGVLAIISGGKIATALLVLGVPVLDTVWAAIRRMIWRKHPATRHLPLHARLLEVGFSSRDATLSLLAISSVFGLTALFLQSAQKFAALFLLAMLAVFLMALGSVAAPLSATERRGTHRRVILGVAVDSTSLQDALACVKKFLNAPGQHLITTPNPEMLVLAQQDPVFKATLNRAALALPDGIGLMFAARWLKAPLATRLPGSEFVWELARLAAEHGYVVGLIGGRVGVAETAAEKLRDRYPSLKTNLDNPSILFVALGHGKQEKWIAAHLSEFSSARVAMGVGGAFDFIAGRVQRAPRMVRLFGLEWFWRLLRQPWRLPRIWRAVVVFPWLVVSEKMKNLSSRQR